MERKGLDPLKRYLRKIGTHETFPYTELLAARGDMEEYDPWSGDHKQKVAPPGEEYSWESFTKKVIGLEREEIRAGLRGCSNKLQRIFWCLLHIWENTSGVQIQNFKPRMRDLTILMGPSLMKDELEMALKVFRENPNKNFLMSEAVNDLMEIN